MIARLWMGIALAEEPAPQARWLAHRGVHQTFSPEGVDHQTCTAQRIHPPTHGYLENTIASMKAAFDAGAGLVEIDLHATADGQVAVFHDATLDCRTDGTGRPEDRTMEELKRLDIGYGYTADGGATFPLRGTGVGLMPSLDEALAAFPDRAFVLDLKSNDPALGDLAADALARLPADRRAATWAYGGPAAVRRLEERLPEVRTFDRVQLKSCLKRYLALGWAGRVPKPCRDTVVMVPISHTGWMWGWNRRFERRMARAGTEVVLFGPYGDVSTGIDDPQTLDLVPVDYGGWIWTNRVEALAPLRP